ncbi:DNA translocase FtsK 4TM domain-containing protein, partial [Acinetobacter baumannii]
MKLRQRLLPEAAQAFLRRRSVETIGLALILVAAMLAAALASYNPADPSLNRAAAMAPRNLLGLPGAFTAD